MEEQPQPWGSAFAAQLKSFRNVLPSCPQIILIRSQPGNSDRSRPYPTARKGEEIPFLQLKTRVVTYGEYWRAFFCKPWTSTISHSSHHRPPTRPSARRFSRQKRPPKSCGKKNAPQCMVGPLKLVEALPRPAFQESRRRQFCVPPWRKTSQRRYTALDVAGASEVSTTFDLSCRCFTNGRP